ncbi:hypothetical protein H0X06_06460 [Candidatus Dependentiae bacterium]|nr:hypothetical protein [Candidatus Dependentiae bacterium]
MKKKLYSLTLVSSLFTFFSITSTGALETESKEMENIIKSVVIKDNCLRVAINEDFKMKWLTSNFFAYYDSDIDLTKIPYSIALLPFIFNIYPIVWISGKDYSIDCMDEDAYYSLEKIKKVFQRLYPQTSFSGNLVPKELIKNRLPAPHVSSESEIAVLFSNGLDSTACSFQHHDKKQLLITAQGQADLPIKKRHLWERQKKKFMQYALDYGHTNAFVRSNYTEFLNRKKLNSISPEIVSWRVDTTEGVGLFGIAAPILFSKGHTTLLIGSSFTWEFPYPTAANPLVDDNLTVADSISLHHEHFNCNRFDKIKLIVDLIKTKKIKTPYLKVCNFNKSGENCCLHCTKCKTVVSGLIALRENPLIYGFRLHTKRVIKKPLRYFSDEQGYWAGWNFCTMQKRLEQIEKLPKKVRWMLTCDFMQKVIRYKVGTKTRVNWQDFRDLAPDTLEIPTTIVNDCCDNNQARKKQERAKQQYENRVKKAADSPSPTKKTMVPKKCKPRSAFSQSVGNRHTQ